PAEATLAEAVELAVANGRGHEQERHPRGTDGAVTSWRQAILRMPYLRDAMARLSARVGTVESARTWGPGPGGSEAARTARGSAGVRPTGHGHLRAHACRPRRRRAVLHGGRARAPRLGAGHVGRDQGRRQRGAAPPRCHDHAPPRGRPRPPPLVRPAAPGPV